MQWTRRKSAYKRRRDELESNVIEDPVLSPRVGLVVQPAEGHSLSVSWSRGFATPTPPNYFLDISAGTAPDDLGRLGYRVRARGTGRDGIRFSNGMGGFQGMRSTCTPPEAGGPSAATLDGRSGALSSSHHAAFSKREIQSRS